MILCVHAWSSEPEFLLLRSRTKHRTYEKKRRPSTNSCRSLTLACAERNDRNNEQRSSACFLLSACMHLIIIPKCRENTNGTKERVKVYSTSRISPCVLLRVRISQEYLILPPRSYFCLLQEVAETLIFNSGWGWVHPDSYTTNAS
ncbi:hypothetical protein SCHPADRAFT_381314 [Schizopora paradoxa]|uniref:Uncharacterized protein n=1 Tax=Schizopora paradoxa TaxID=27342 RepID=A0A0H2S8H3_9AGAM|nr:hypothetical protein SCHPADRAFT_381314 [Schizopora paradoxa]